RSMSVTLRGITAAARRPRVSAERSAFAQTLVFVANERRKQVTDDAAQAGLDLDGDGHSGREIDAFVFDLHLGAVERDPGGISQLLAFRLAAACFRAL